MHLDIADADAIAHVHGIANRHAIQVAHVHGIANRHAMALHRPHPITMKYKILTFICPAVLRLWVAGRKVAYVNGSEGNCNWAILSEGWVVFQGDFCKRGWNFVFIFHDDCREGFAVLCSQLYLCKTLQFQGMLMLMCVVHNARMHALLTLLLAFVPVHALTEWSTAWQSLANHLDSGNALTVSSVPTMSFGLRWLKQSNVALDAHSGRLSEVVLFGKKPCGAVHDHMDLQVPSASQDDPSVLHVDTTHPASSAIHAFTISSTHNEFSTFVRALRGPDVPDELAQALAAALIRPPTSLFALFRVYEVAAANDASIVYGYLTIRADNAMRVVQLDAFALSGSQLAHVLRADSPSSSSKYVLSLLSCRGDCYISVPKQIVCMRERTGAGASFSRTLLSQSTTESRYLLSAFTVL